MVNKGPSFEEVTPETHGPTELNGTGHFGNFLSSKRMGNIGEHCIHTYYSSNKILDHSDDQWHSKEHQRMKMTANDAAEGSPITVVGPQRKCQPVEQFPKKTGKTLELGQLKKLPQLDQGKSHNSDRLVLEIDH